MMLQKRVDRALKFLQDKANERKNARPYEDEIYLEKGDKLAMALSALIVIVPVALVALLIMVGVAALWVL
ncbi:MAG: hypothetical protein ACOX6Y_00805 [Christensenellales bacterium]|jgi:hypothetical protein